MRKSNDKDRDTEIQRYRDTETQRYKDPEREGDKDKIGSFVFALRKYSNITKRTETMTERQAENRQ